MQQYINEVKWLPGTDTPETIKELSVGALFRYQDGADNTFYMKTDDGGAPSGFPLAVHLGSGKLYTVSPDAKIIPLPIGERIVLTRLL